METPGVNTKRYLAGAYNQVTGHLVWVRGKRKASELFIELSEEIALPLQRVGNGSPRGGQLRHPLFQEDQGRARGAGRKDSAAFPAELLT